MNHRVGDWMKFNCGDRVTEVDGRHIGRVEMINHGHSAWIKWEDTGWFSEVLLGDIRKVKSHK